MIDIDDDPSELPDETVSAIDASANTRIKDRVKREAEEDKLFWTAVLQSPIGRRIMWQDLMRLNTFTERFAMAIDGSPSDAATWLQAGEQKTGMFNFMRLLRYDPAGTMLMLTEFHPDFAQPKPKGRKRTPDDDA